MPSGVAPVFAKILKVERYYARMCHPGKRIMQKISNPLPLCFLILDNPNSKSNQRFHKKIGLKLKDIQVDVKSFNFTLLTRETLCCIIFLVVLILKDK